MEDDYTHPGFLDQPFVRVPRQEPNQDIDFRAGDIIYENPKVTEWSRLGFMGTVSAYFYLCAYWPVMMLYKTHIPNSEMLFSRTDSFKFFSMNEIDKFGSAPLMHSLGFSALLYLFLKMASSFTSLFVTRMQYNINKDLLFVSVVDELGMIKEKTYELSNVERVVRADKGSLIYSSENEGFTVLKCLSTKDYLIGKINNY